MPILSATNLNSPFVELSSNACSNRESKHQYVQNDNRCNTTEKQYYSYTILRVYYELQLSVYSRIILQTKADAESLHFNNVQAILSYKAPYDRLLAIILYKGTLIYRWQGRATDKPTCIILAHWPFKNEQHVNQASDYHFV